MTNSQEMIVNENAGVRTADGWFTPGRFALILAGLIAATFSGVLLGQVTFYYRDFALFGYPLAYYQRERFWQGELPLWDPLNFCGVPFLAQWNTLTLYPPSLFYLIFPLSWALGVFNLAHMFWAGLGMYFLAHRWTRNRLAASVAGVAYAFNGLTWHSLMWPNNIAALGWMPWVVLLVERAWRWNVDEPRSNPESTTSRGFFHPQSGRQAIVLAALAGAMQMLAGAPEVIILTWTFIGALWLAQFIWARIPKKQMLRRMPVIVLLVAGLAAAQLLPFFQFLQHSQRNSGFGGADWAMPLSGPANFLVPLFHCFQASQGIFVQYGQYWVSSHYLGAGLMVLAATGTIFVKKRRIWLLLALALFCIWMAMGAQGFLYPIARRTVPLLGLMRYPIKFVVLPIFIIPLLAAYGVRWLQAQAACGNPARARNVLVNISVVALLLIGVIVLVEWKHPLISDNWTATWHNALGRAAFVALVPGILILSVRAVQFKIQVLLRCFLLALLWTDVYTHAPALNPTIQRSIYEPRAVRAPLKLPSEPQAGEPRFMEANAVMAQVHLLSLSNSVDEYICHRIALYDDCNLLDDVPKTDGFFSLALREPLSALGLVYESDDRHVDLKGMKDFLGIAHVSLTNADAAKSLDWADRDSAMPLITGGQQPIFASDAQTDAGLMSARFDPRKTVYLPVDARNEAKATGADVKIISPQIRPEKISFETDASAPAMVTLAQAYYRPWHAYVDGHRVTLWRANAGFQALEVPAGKHAVKVHYEDGMFEAGAFISCASLFILGVTWFSGRRKAG